MTVLKICFFQGYNLTSWIKQIVDEGEMKYAELFVFMDNLAIDSTLYKGR